MTNKRNSSEIDESVADTHQSETKMPKLEEDQAQDKTDHSMSFPEQLMHILDNDNESKGTVVWKEDGSTFWISTKEFVEEVLRVRFAGKFESFVRKLNRWGFKRIHDQSLPYGTVAYRHEMFKRGHPEKLKNMSGVKKKVKVQSELFVLREEAGSAPSLLSANYKPLPDQLRVLLQQPQASTLHLARDSIEQALLQKQMLQLLGHSVTSPFQSALNMQQDLRRLNPSFQPPDDAEMLLNQLLQQRIARLSATQMASVQLAAISTSRASAEPSLLRLQQQLNNRFV